MSAMNLHKFWGDKPATFVLYDLPTTAPPSVHLTTDKGYFWQMRMSHDSNSAA
jgi:hypothetical protein